MKKSINLVLLLMATFVACAQNMATNLDGAALPPDFSSMSYEEARQAIKTEENLIFDEKVKKVDSKYIANLVRQLGQDNLTSEKMVLIVYLMGELHPHDTNSIEVLIENIDLKATRFDPKDAISIKLWGEYPAEEALVKIGQPAVIPVLNHLSTETNELRRHLLCEVLKQVEGKQIAQNQIQQKLAAELDSTKQVNLKLVLEELEK